MSETLDDDGLPQLPESLSGSDEVREPRPRAEMARYSGTQKLAGRAALVTAGDSGIGRAVAIALAKEGADVAITWLNEAEDAMDTYRLLEEQGVRVLSIPGDVADSAFCTDLVAEVVTAFSRIDILVNTAAQPPTAVRLEDLLDDAIESSFRTAVFGKFFLTRAALPHIEPGGAIINTTSELAHAGSSTCTDAAAAAIIGFTRSLAAQLAERAIRVNAVALPNPGPIPTGEAAQPDELAPSYVFLASSDAAHMTGQVLRPAGGIGSDG